MKSKVAARLLEMLLVFSAGLCRTWQRTAILDAYPLLLEFRNIYRGIDEQLLRSREMFSIANFKHLTARLAQYSPRELIITTAHHGHFIAFMNACARYGVPLAVCYKAASRPYLETAIRNRLKLVKVSGHRSVHSLFQALDRERMNGRYIVITMDGPFDSRRRYDFLGYRVAASSLAPLYAQKTHSVLLPLIPSVSADLQLSFTEGPIIENIGVGAAQQLLNFLQQTILEQPFQHHWLSNSILMSDVHARDNAVGYLTEALAWRENQT